jgi:hypothetical protein
MNKEEDYIHYSFLVDGIEVDLAQTHCGMNPTQLCDPKSAGMMTTHAFSSWYRVDGGPWKKRHRLDEYAADILAAWKKKNNIP